MNLFSLGLGFMSWSIPVSSSTWWFDTQRLSCIGLFINYEISPLLVVHSETRQSFAHFLTSYVTSSFLPLPFPARLAPCRIAYTCTYTSFLPYRTCAIVGGVLTIATIVDSVLFATGKRLKKGSGGVTNGYNKGKLM